MQADHTTTPGWIPIGTSSTTPFKGTFNGAGHTISGLWINRETTNDIGLFGYTDSPAVIQNLTVTIDTGKGGVIGGSYVGGLVGYGSQDLTITNCAVLPMAGATAAMVTGKGLVTGGLVGENSYAPITASFFNETVNSGLEVAGLNSGTITTSRGASTDEMKQQGTYTAASLGANVWDFNTVWGIKPTINDGYPFLLALRDTYTEVIPTPDPDPRPTAFTVTLMADPGINILPSAGTHGATIGGSFTFYVTLAEGFEGRTPQATVNGDPVQLTLRPNGTEWMYVIPQVYDDTRVVVSFNTTANDPASAPRLYTRDRQLYVETPRPLTLSAYALSGQTVVSRRLSEGLTTITLPQGSYVVKVDEWVEKVVVK